MAAPNVSAFLASVEESRRREVEHVRRVIRDHLPKGYEEVVSKNMLVYQVPLRDYEDTYNGHPLWYVALASEKSYFSLHLMPVYGNTALAARLQERFAAAGKRLDMGKACIRFRRADDLALDAIGDIIAAMPMSKWIEIARSARRKPQRSRKR